jgi:hypothetical protein
VCLVASKSSTSLDPKSAGPSPEAWHAPYLVRHAKPSMEAKPCGQLSAVGISDGSLDTVASERVKSWTRVDASPRTNETKPFILSANGINDTTLIG